MNLPRSSAVALAIVLAAPSAFAEEPTEPTRGLSVSVNAPPSGPWTMVLRNDGPAPLRIAADVRHLTLEVIAPPELPRADKKPRRPSVVLGYPRGSLPACRMPAEMRPAEPQVDRALVLQPGERYIEAFDPVLLCGAGKLSSELAGGAIVYPTFGWPLPKRTVATAKKKAAPPPPPYVAESLKVDDGVSPTRVVQGAGVMLAAAPEPPADPEVATKGEPVAESGAPVDEHAPRLTLHAAAHADAGDSTDVAVSVRLANVGKRKTAIHLRADDLEVSVLTPTGKTVHCAAGSERRAALKDFFDTLAPGAHRSVSLHLRERCPTGTFDRPGAYTLTATLLLRDSGREWGLSAFVGRVPAATTTHLRVRTGKLPFYAAPPRVGQPAAPSAADDDD